MGLKIALVFEDELDLLGLGKGEHVCRKGAGNG